MDEIAPTFENYLLVVDLVSTDSLNYYVLLEVPNSLNCPRFDVVKCLAFSQKILTTDYFRIWKGPSRGLDFLLDLGS